MNPTDETDRQARPSRFGALRVRNYRLFWTGQLISQVGTWLSLTAVSWMVLTELHGGGTDIGLIAAAQFAPTLLFVTWAGVLTDRFALRRYLIVTQSLLLAAATALALLKFTGAIRLWMVFPLIAAQGLASAFDNPGRQSFVSELVGPERIANAVALNSAGFNSARIIGPAIAGLLIAFTGTGICFALNAVSFLAAIVALVMMRDRELHPRARVARARGQIRDGIRYAASVPVLRITLLTMAIVGTISMNFTVLVPLLARTTFHASAGTFGLLSTSMGVGSLVGALRAARMTDPTLSRLSRSSFALGACMLATAASPVLLVACVAVAVTGACVMTFLATTNSLLQLYADPAVRGRVLSLYLVLFIGTSPFGSPLVGWIAQQFGTRTSFVYGALGALAGGALIVLLQRSSDAVHEGRIAPPAANITPSQEGAVV